MIPVLLSISYRIYRTSLANSLYCTYTSTRIRTMTTQPQSQNQPERPWYEAYPAPRNVAASVTREEVLQWFRDGRRPGTDFVLVDLRRTDFEVCIPILACIMGSSGRNIMILTL